MPTLFGRSGRLVLAALLAFVLAGCGGGSSVSGTDGSVVSQASTPAGTTGSISVTTNVAASKLPVTTATLRISLMQDGVLAVAAGLTNPSTFPSGAGSHTDTIPNVPPGAYTVVVEALDANGVLLGLAPPVASVVANRTAEVVVNDLYTVKSVAVTPATVALPPTAMQALSAVATLSNGATLVATVLGQWVSATPAVATVSATGTVKAVAAGATRVTFTYGGASADANVTVSGAAPTPTPSPSPSPTPSPTTVNMTTTSLDRWKQTASGLTTTDYAYDPGTQTSVLVGSSGIVVRIDGSGASTYQEISKTVNFTGVAFLAGKGFVAVGAAGTIIWSADGTTWTAATTNPVPNTVDLRDVCAYTNGTASGFVAVGATDGVNGRIVHSTDGKTWTDISVAANNVNYTAVASGTIGGSYVFEVASDTASQCQYQILSADTAPTATWAATASTHAGMRAIAYAQSAGTGFFVLSGDSGWVDINAKGDTWASASTAQIAGSPNVRGVAYGRNGTTDTISFLANTAKVFVDNTFSAANTGHSYVAGTIVFPSGTSPAYTGTPNGRLRYANGTFYGTGAGNALLRGVDGQAYEVNHYTSGASVQSVACGTVNGAPLYVAVGTPDAANPFGAGKAQIMTSLDGTSWTQQDPGPLGSLILTGVCYGNGRFVTITMDGQVGISTDGVTWTMPTTNTMGNHGYWAVTYAPTANRFVVSGTGWIGVSTDGTADSWSDAAKGLGQGFGVTTGTVGGVEMFVQCGLDGGKSAIAWATDPTGTWTNVQLTPTDMLAGIAFNNGMFVAVGASGRIVTSTDGKTFTDRGTFGTQGFNSVTGVTTPDGSGSFVGWIAVGNGGAIFTSSDAITWSAATTQTATTQVLKSIAFDTSVNTSVDPVTNVTTHVYSTRFVVGGVNSTMLLDI